VGGSTHGDPVKVVQDRALVLWRLDPRLGAQRASRGVDESRMVAVMWLVVMSLLLRDST